MPSIHDNQSSSPGKRSSGSVIPVVWELNIAATKLHFPVSGKICFLLKS